MVNALEQLAQLAPLAMAGFGKRTETADRVMGIQEYQKQLDEKERVKKAGREIIELSANSPDGFNADAIMAVAKKYDAPFEPLLQTMVAFKKFQKMGEPEPELRSKLLNDGRVLEAKISPKDPRAAEFDLLGKVQGRSNELDKIKHKEMMDLRNNALKAISEYRNKRLDYQGQSLSETRRHNSVMESKAGSGGSSSKLGRLVQGVDDAGNPMFFRDTPEGLVPVKGAKPKTTSKTGSGVGDDDKKKKWVVDQINKRLDDKLKVIQNSVTDFKNADAFMKKVLAEADKERRMAMAGKMPEWLSPEGAETPKPNDPLSPEDRAALEEIRKALK